MFVELHARSAFSFLRGASQPEELVQVAASLNQPAIAVLDRDGVYGSVRQHLAAKKLGLQAHAGAEVTCTDGSVYPLLCETRKGYQNLCRLITRMKMRAAKGEGAATPEEIAEFAEGLVCLAGTNGSPSLETAVLIFGKENVFAELQRHLCREEEARNQHVAELAGRLGVPLLATNGASCAHPEQRQILDVFTCIREHTTIADAGRLLSRNSERCLKSYAEMDRLFADFPHAVRNTT
ncbi:MAG: PHP domain-containing protein, partial [Bryobacteraceae bacterium]|nr:PHP domain-containing protein [Bryobacteraceae bacterium]